MYENQIWSLTVQRQEDKIIAITQMRMLRHIYNIDWEDHVTRKYKGLGQNKNYCNRHEEETSSMVWTCTQKGLGKY